MIKIQNEVTAKLKKLGFSRDQDMRQMLIKEKYKRFM